MKHFFWGLSLLLCLADQTYAQQKGPRLIVRGDDMGYSHSGNEAIIHSYKNGIQRSVEISEWDNVKWRPVSDCASLKDADGYFYPMIWPNKNYPGRAVMENKWRLEDVEKEFRAQIELAIKKLPGITHISGHMGCAGLNDSVKAMVKRLAKEYKIDSDPQEHGVKGVSYKGPRATAAEKIKSFIAMLGELQPGRTYIFVDHPGFDTPELRAISHIGYENVAADRQGVTDLFTSEEVRSVIKQKNIQLISYKDLILQ
jgi:predicted glycoside hydrolase/deacetylase ChbG (UPF0249 family)